MNADRHSYARVYEDDRTLSKLKEARKGATGEMKRCIEQAIADREQELQDKNNES